MKSISFWLLCPILFFNTSQIYAEYLNSNGKPIEKSFWDLLEWSTSDVDTKIDFIKSSDDWKNINLEADNNYTIWIGHSTFLIKKNGYTILTDPIFSERASPLKNIGPKRLIPPAIPLHRLPRIDFVTVSHNHYDHLDTVSLKEIYKNNLNAIFLVPAGDKRLLQRKGIKNIFEYEWWGGIQSR